VVDDVVFVVNGANDDDGGDDDNDDLQPKLEPRRTYKHDCAYSSSHAFHNPFYYLCGKNKHRSYIICM